MKRLCLTLFFACLTIVFELAATALPFIRQEGARLLPSLVMHAGAVVTCACAARWRRSPERLLPAELDTVLITAIFVPLAGPILGWVIPRRTNEDEVVDAHEAMVARERSSELAGAARSTFTGGFARDYARKTDTLTYAQVMRSGSVAEKRSVIQRLCQGGEPRQLADVRRALSDVEDEVRLFAYAELERIEHTYEEALATLEDRLMNEDDQTTIRVELAAKHLDYSRSGVLDPDFARFHLRRALQRAEEAFEWGGDGPSCARIGLLARLDLGRATQAEAWLDRFAPAVLSHPTVRLALAELAFATRDLEGARSIARELSDDATAPRWLKALQEPTRAPLPGLRSERVA
jgi:hypothetical protein